MKVIGLLAWYDEPASWLAAMVTSLAPHVDHLVAVDGAYALFPDAEAQSRSDQAAAIVELSQAAGLGLTLHRPEGLWLENEVEKRTFLFRAAELASEPDDWYFVMDADQVVDRCPEDLKARLQATDLDCAEVTFWERGDPFTTAADAQRALAMAENPDHTYLVRCLFRAIPGLHVHTAHYVYRTPDGRHLWGNPAIHELERPLDLTDLRVEHRSTFRPLFRRAQQADYYQSRDREQAEAMPCRRCDQVGTRVVQIDWERVGNSVDSISVWACDLHAEEILTEGQVRLAELGFDADAIEYSHSRSFH